MSIILQQSTNSLIAEYECYPWFSQVGKPISNEQVRQVDSWQEADAACDCPVTQWALMEGHNVLTIALYERNKDHYRQWNDILKVIESAVKPIVQSQVLPILNRYSSANMAASSLEWQLISACLELEYSRDYDSQLFRSQVYYYSIGHFACGWYVANSSDFPDNAVSIVY